MSNAKYMAAFVARTLLFFLIVHFYGMLPLLLTTAAAILTIVMDKC